MKHQLSISGTSFPSHLYHRARQSMVRVAGIGFMAAFLLLPGLSLAGVLDSPAAPTATGSAMFTITDIYNRLNTGATVTKRTGAFTEPAGAPTAGTGKTLDDVMTLVNSRAHAVCAGTLNGTRWCDNGNGSVTDLTTGLIWLKDAAWGGAVALWLNSISGTNAHARAAQVKNGIPATLTDGSVAGDWRLPTLKELKQLTTGTEPVLSGTMRAFTGVQANNYWSSSTSTQPGVTNAAYSPRLDTGVINNIFKGSTLFVWPVRGGQ